MADDGEHAERVRRPRYQRHGILARMPAISERAESGTGARVLVVDDDEGLLEMYGELLREVSPPRLLSRARNGKDALELLDWEPDLIVLDLFTPVMAGYEFPRRLRERSDGRRVPVLVVSGGNAVHIPHGGDVLLRKPFDVDRLTSAIEAMLAARATEPRPL